MLNFYEKLRNIYQIPLSIVSIIRPEVVGEPLPAVCYLSKQKGNCDFTGFDAVSINCFSFILQKYTRVLYLLIMISVRRCIYVVKECTDSKNTIVDITVD